MFSLHLTARAGDHIDDLELVEVDGRSEPVSSLRSHPRKKKTRGRNARMQYTYEQKAKAVAYFDSLPKPKKQKQRP